jgi:hypothetical protein
MQPRMDAGRRGVRVNPTMEVLMETGTEDGLVERAFELARRRRAARRVGGREPSPTPQVRRLRGQHRAPSTSEAAPSVIVFRDAELFNAPGYRVTLVHRRSVGRSRCRIPRRSCGSRRWSSRVSNPQPPPPDATTAKRNPVPIGCCRGWRCPSGPKTPMLLSRERRRAVGAGDGKEAGGHDGGVVTEQHGWFRCF